MVVVVVEAEGEGFGELMEEAFGGVAVRGGVGREEGEEAVGGGEVGAGDEVGAAEEELAHLMMVLVMVEDHMWL